MNDSMGAAAYTVVKNFRGDYSIWRSDRTPLPTGWTALPFAGERAACLAYIEQEWSPIEISTPVPQIASTEALVRATCSTPFPQVGAALRIFVFPHAGSGASFYHFLARELKQTAAVAHLIQYPGREMRVKEEPIRDMPTMVATLLAGLRPVLTEGAPFAFFGHSMGALIAYELAHALREHGLPQPAKLLLSGRQAPHLPARNLPVDSLSDQEFLDAIGRRYNAIPQQLLEHPEILGLILPSLRADFGLMEKYRFQPRPPLSMPLVLLNGREDPWVSPTTLDPWQEHTTAAVRQHLFDGDHFYLPANAQGLRNTLLT